MYSGRIELVLASHSDSYSKLDSISVSASELSDTVHTGGESLQG